MRSGGIYQGFCEALVERHNHGELLQFKSNLPQCMSLTLVSAILQNQLRRVSSPANFAVFRQLASLQTSAQPCHDAVVQRTANAAGKEQPTAKSQARFPGWLASVATCGAAAGVYTFNSEDVPLTGRRQLLFRCQLHNPTPCAHLLTWKATGTWQLTRFPHHCSSKPCSL